MFEECKTRDDVAVVYANLLIKCNALNTWSEINKEIIDRWSYSGLEYVKTKAWKIAEKKGD